jgi:hypothetical protein
VTGDPGESIPLRLSCSGALDAFEDDVSVGGGITGADEADGVGDALFEGEMSFPSDLGFGAGREGIIEGRDRLRRIGSEEFLGLPDVPDLEVGLKSLEHVEDGGDPADQGEVNRFDPFPEREGPVADDEGVGVADAGHEVEDVRVQNAFLEHEFRRMGRFV